MSLPEALAPLARAADRAAVVVDYDGTLSPIVDDPDRAVPLPAARDALGALVGQLALVGVVSGRPVDVLRARLGLHGVALVGQYGLERLVDREIEVDVRALPYVDAVAAAAAEAEDRWPDLLVERKGRIAAAVHWRGRGAGPPRAELHGLASRHGLAAFDSRMACELRPPVDHDKGTALAALLAEVPALDHAAFAGDDRGDLDAFDGLDVWEGGDRGRRGVRIAVRSPEAPPELLDRADIVVEGPPGVAALLRSVGAATRR